MKAYRVRYSANRRNARNSICYMAYARRILSAPNYFPFSPTRRREIAEIRASCAAIENRYTETVKYRHNSPNDTMFFYGGSIRRLTI